MTKGSKNSPLQVRGGRAKIVAAKSESLSLREVRRRFQNGEPVPEAVRRRLAQFDRTLAHVTDGVRRGVQFHPDRLIRNLLRATDPDISDATRLRAARKIRTIVQAGIAKQRRHLIERDLWSMARNPRPTTTEDANL